MPRLLQHAVEQPRPCSYLPDRLASLEHRVMEEVSPDVLEVLISRGWRRFGRVYFRPRCSGCGECVTLRIPVATFQPTRSQLRARRRCLPFEVRLGKPQVDAERLALYQAWHSGREATRSWEPSALDAPTYFQQFAWPHPAAHELTFRDQGRLVAVALCDLTPRAWSAVYFFSHPDIARCSPGVAQVLIALELARERGLEHVYLGYRILGCPSMRYKAAFHPHELLAGRPALDEVPTWTQAP